jgi:nitroimidazol reductase NimA-like FMN-containing flavoprotein (pyridoxamine 5'-phosphate oxidase superfamily)
MGQVRPQEWVIDGTGLEIMPPSVSHQLLEASEIGRLAFLDAGQPVVLPVNFCFCDGRIVFQTTVGSKLHASANGSEVAFEIDDWDAKSRTGWSVLVRGRAGEVEDEEEIGAMCELGLRPWADRSHHTSWVQVVPTEIDGRRIPRRSAGQAMGEARH